ncbi:DUF2793 domain-containing protein [Sphingomonas sp.]|uniref:DUF2793 domain-containing protein n=1 Tax=Sphingomonas sp. TaxID=28214 RepID=UPI001DC9A028|nr:DUF2793 domain-containing protein [Sphingomonas sp.]MBX9796085.1 DUF2793 domain-containing protein [Sphingomonas sp.]
MTDQTSARLALPLLQPGQAQKELYHNEALVLLDLAVQPVVDSLGLNAPPPSPALGQAWIVGATPAGAWAGQAGAIAGWTGGGWRFVAPLEGMTVWSIADARPARHRGGAWQLAPLPAIAPPQGGETIDSPARAAIGAILAALAAHGLIAP